MNRGFYKFVLYRCLKCDSNVVCYGNRVGLISDRLFKKLLLNNKIKSCGDIFSFPKDAPIDIIFPRSRKEPISGDDIADLRILLATEKDSKKIISML